MPIADARTLARTEWLLRRIIPGRALTLLAATPVPVLAVERNAARRPDPGHDDPTVSPLVCELALAPTGTGSLADAAVVVKDAIDVAGIATTSGVDGPAPIAARDAIMVARIRAAGGRIVGKAKMTELGMDGLGPLMPWPMPTNPRAPGYLPGGSSTGTAVAIARGLARYGLGSDGLGSVRIPAALCGLVGLKPGRQPWLADGYRSPVRTLDVCGPLAATVADCARLWQVLSGQPVAPIAPALPRAIGIVRQLGPDRACRVVARGFARAIAALGVRPTSVELPGAAASTFLGAIIGARELADSGYADGPLSPAGRMNVAAGRALGAVDVARLDGQRRALIAATADALAVAPILAMPTTAVPAPAATASLVAGGQDLMLMRAIGCYTPLANLCDLPAIAVPCGIDDRGRPLSIMFMGERGSEGALLAIAAAVETTGLGAAPIA